MDRAHRVVVPAINGQCDGDGIVIVDLNLEAQQIDNWGVEESILARGWR